jgi:hypothetical protein
MLIVHRAGALPPAEWSARCSIEPPNDGNLATLLVHGASGVERRAIPQPNGANRLIEVADSRDGDTTVVRAFVAALEPGWEVVHGVREARQAFVYLVEGAVSVGPEDLGTGDAVLTDAGELTIRAWQPSRFVVADLPSGQAPDSKNPVI